MQGKFRSSFDGRALGAAVVVCALISSGVPALRAQGSAAVGLTIVDPHARFEDRYQFETVTRVYEVHNSGSSPVRITQSIALDGTGEIRFEPAIVPPGGGARITVEQPLRDRLGEVAFRYAILTDEPGTPRYRFTLSGFAQSAYDPERSRFEFGTLDRARGGLAELELASREVDRLRIVAVEEAPPFLSLSWSDASADGESPARLAASLLPGAPQGLLSGSVRLRTNVPSQSQVAIQYLAQVFGDVVPSQNPLSLGAIRLGETGIAVVRLESRTGRPFEIAPATPEGAHSLLGLTLRGCSGAPSPSACRELEVRFTPLLPGPIGGTIELQVAGDSSVLPLVYSGLAIHPDTVIQQLSLPEPAGDLPAPAPRP
jgi:hypothetical protein